MSEEQNNKFNKVLYDDGNTIKIQHDGLCYHLGYYIKAQTGKRAGGYYVPSSVYYPTLQLVFKDVFEEMLRRMIMDKYQNFKDFHESINLALNQVSAIAESINTNNIIG
jgi:hypothetical protein